MTFYAEVVRLASRQGGYATRRQLIDLGVSRRAIDRRVAAGDFVVLAKSLYQIVPPDDYVDLLRGAVLHLSGAVVSHESAAHLLSFPRLPRLVPTVTVPSHTTHVFPGLTVHRCSDLDSVDITRVDRLPVTNVARTAFDLAGLLEYDVFEDVAEALLQDGRLLLRHFEQVTDRLCRRGKRGAVAARVFLADRSEGPPDATVLERRGRSVLAAAGLPVPVAQHPIPWDKRRRFDDAYPEWMFAIEWDSKAWHSQQTAMNRDRSRDREAAMHGWVVVRFTWRDVTEHADVVAATVASLLQSRHPAS